MSDKVRQKNGRFAKGQTGNPKGRPFKRDRDPKLPAARRDAIFRVADRLIPINLDGKTEKISIFEACILQLGRAGAMGNRISAKDFIQMAMATSETDLTHRVITMNMINRMNAIEEENEVLRAKSGTQSGVFVAPKEFWESISVHGPERRIDDGIHKEGEEE